MKKAILEKFAQVGSEEVVVESNDTLESMKQVFIEYPNKFFTQAEFVKVLSKSNPFINHQLHKLLAEGVIAKQGSKRKYYYKRA